MKTMTGGTLLSDLLALLNTSELASLGPEQREGRRTISELEKDLAPAFKDKKLTPAVKDLLRSLIFLWHDHLDEAHEIAQNLENADGSYIHAIMHRREPDYSNAKYWLRRVGKHPAYLGLALKVSGLLKKAGESDLESRLLPNNSWDAFAYVDAVSEALNGQFVSKARLLQEIQKLEFESLLENLINRI